VQSQWHSGAQSVTLSGCKSVTGCKVPPSDGQEKAVESEMIERLDRVDYSHIMVFEIRADNNGPSKSRDVKMPFQ